MKPPQENTIHNNKLIQSLKVLSSEELKQLSRWLQSPWANSNKKVYELYLLLKNYAPNYEASQLTRNFVFKELYPEKPFNDRWLRNIMAELNKQIESFTIHQRLEQEEHLKKILLAKEYEKRHQTNRLLKLAKDLNSSLEAKNNKSLEDYYYGCFLNDLLYYSPEANTLWKGEPPLLNRADVYLDEFYLLAKWRYRSEFTERRRLLKEEKQPDFDLTILERIGKDLSIPAVDLYQLKRIEGSHLSEDQFEKLKEVYFHHFDQLSIKDQKIFYFYLLNILARIRLSGNQNLNKKLFDLYLYGIQHQLLVQNNLISVQTYNNIITLGNIVKEFKAVEIFINTQTLYLAKKDRVDGKIWGLAHLQFHSSNYIASIELLHKHIFKSYVFKLQGRILLLQAYFEVLLEDESYYSLLHDYINAITKYFHREKQLSKRRKTAYLNLIRYLSKLIDYLNANEKSKDLYLKLEKEVDHETSLQAKNWLKEKIQLCLNKIQKK